MSTEQDVRDASRRFYEALNVMLAGNAGPMTQVWSHSTGVTTMHPIGGRQVGWTAVSEPWTQIAAMAGGGTVRLQEQLIQAFGDVAYETGVERGSLTLAGQAISDVDARVTNIYRRETDGWKIVHHHTDLSPAMIDIMRRIQAAG